jgi:talin
VATEKLGTACIAAVHIAHIVKEEPEDKPAKKVLFQATTNILENAAYVLSALTAMAPASQACINAFGSIDALVSDLDTSIMFATTGCLSDEEGDLSFAALRLDVLAAAQDMIDAANEVFRVVDVSARNGMLTLATQEDIASSVVYIETSYPSLLDQLKLAAMAISSADSSAQVCVEEVLFQVILYDSHQRACLAFFVFSATFLDPPAFLDFS